MTRDIFGQILFTQAQGYSVKPHIYNFPTMQVAVFGHLSKYLNSPIKECARQITIFT
jgi:hypothetical protein